MKHGTDFSMALGELLDIVTGVVRGDGGAVRGLDAMTGRQDVPGVVAELAEQINHLSIQNEVREMRLEKMIEDLLEAQAALDQAQHDPLTGLPNRALFHELLRKACAEARRADDILALMFVDLDRFKQVNDRMGHDAGDELLVQVARRLRGCLRAGDVVGRLGGDEFAVVLKELDDRQTAVRIAERIVADLVAPFGLTAGEADIGGSVGLSFFPDDADQPLSLLKNADIAMYRAKEAGRNTYRVYGG